MEAPRRPVRGHLVAGLAYLALSFVVTWPLVTQFTTHVVGTDIDEGAFLWNLWWVRHALLDLRQSPFQADFIFFPVGADLATYTLAPLNGLLSLPVQLLAGPIVANNVVLIASLALSGFGAYLLARDVLDRLGKAAVGEFIVWPSAFVAGLLFAFPASRFVYAALGQANFTSTWALPFYLLFLIRAVDRAVYPRKPGRVGLVGLPALAGLAFGAAVLSDLTYAVFLSLLSLPFVVAAFGQAWSVGAERRDRIVRLSRVVAALAVVGVIAFGAIAPVLPAFLTDRSFAGSPLTEAERFSADLISLLTPTRLSTWFGGLSKEWSADFRDMPIGFLGFVSLAIGLAGAWRFRRQLAAWIVSLVGAVILMLGPVLTVAGQNRFDIDGLVVRLPLPYLLLHFVPFAGANRVPNRFSILATLALAMLLAAGLVALLGSVWRWRAIGFTLAVLSGLAVFGEHLSIPLPTREATPPALYRDIGNDPDDYTILQLPLGWRNSFGIQGSEKTILQSYQSAHRKRLIGGNTSRNPASTFSYFRRVPFFRSLIAIEEGKPLDPGALERDRASVDLLLDLLDIRYLAVDRRYSPKGAEEYAREVLPLEPVQLSGETALYRIRRAEPTATRRIDLGAAAGDALLFTGWGENETGAGDVTLVWANERSAELFLPPASRPLLLTFRLTPFVYTGMPAQRLTVQMNGVPIVSDRVLDPGWAELRVEVPASALRQPINRLSLRFSSIASPSEVAGSTDRRNLAAAFDWIEIAEAR